MKMLKKMPKLGVSTSRHRYARGKNIYDLETIESFVDYFKTMRISMSKLQWRSRGGGTGVIPHSGQRPKKIIRISPFSERFENFVKN